MIISHEYRYLFVQMPHTASTAIGRELCENYAGVPILNKHAHYHEFLESAAAEEKKYFVFAGVRNPLDMVVTRYFKRKTDHQGFFTDPKYWQKYGGHVSDKALREYAFIRDDGADFPAYFKKFYRFPYDSWGSPSPQEFDFVIRYENLQAGFARVLELLEIRPERPLPVVNPTDEKGDDFRAYYTPEIRDRARRVFGPYMRKWGFHLPSDWGDQSVPRFSQVQFDVLGVLRRHLVWRSSSSARLFGWGRHFWHSSSIRRGRS